MSRIGSTAVAGGAIGMSAGPLGAAAGFVGGSAFGVAKELVAALNANTEAEKQMVALYGKEGYGKRIAGYRDKAARRSMMEAYAFEKELDSISTSSLKEAESTLASLISTIS